MKGTVYKYLCLQAGVEGIVARSRCASQACKKERNPPSPETLSSARAQA